MQKRRKMRKRSLPEVDKTDVPVKPKPNFSFIGKFSGVIGIFLGKFVKALFTDD